MQFKSTLLMSLILVVGLNVSGCSSSDDKPKSTPAGSDVNTPSETTPIPDLKEPENEIKLHVTAIDDGYVSLRWEADKPSTYYLLSRKIGRQEEREIKLTSQMTYIDDPISINGAVPIVYTIRDFDNIGSDTVPVSQTVMILSDESYQRHAAGDTYSIRVDEENRLWMWGYMAGNGFPDGGKVGPDQSSVPVEINVSSMGGDEFLHVDASYGHAVALTRSGNVWTWGASNDKGQLNKPFIGDESKLYQVNLPQLGFARAVMVKAGKEHSLILDDKSRVWSWGANQFKQLGNPAQAFILDHALNEVDLSPLGGARVVQIETYNNTNYVLDENGEVWSWGSNASNLLGRNITTGVNYTDEIGRIDASNLSDASNGELFATQLAAGESHALLVDQIGQVWAWGENSSGQLGTGDYDDRAIPTRTTHIYEPISNIFAGKDYSLATSSHNAIWAWGSNEYGQLMTDSLNNQNSPGVMFLGSTLDIRVGKIHAGADHALMEDSAGVIWAWGSNWRGMLGDGSEVDRNALAQVTGASEPEPEPEILPDMPSSVTYEYENTCPGISECFDSIWLEWDNATLVTRVYRSLSPEYSPSTAEFGFTTTLSSDVGSIRSSNFDTEVEPGVVYYYYLLAISDGKFSEPYRLRVHTPPLTPALLITDVTEQNIELTWPNDFADVSYRLTRSSPTTGTEIVYEGNQSAFTDSVFGQNINALSYELVALVDNVESITSTNADPELILDVIPPTRDIQLIADGDVGFALESNGAIWAWGGNGHWQLGDGTTEDSSLPMELNLTALGEARFVDVKSNNDNSIALDSLGNVWAWGKAGALLGNNTFSFPDVESPAKIDLSNVTAIDLSRYHAMALDGDGNVWSWGAVSPTSRSNSVPTMIDFPELGNETIEMLAAGDTFSMVLDSAGQVWVWGSNYTGQLGIEGAESTDVPMLLPVELFENKMITSITAGEEHAVALDEDGRVWQWGEIVGADFGAIDQLDSPTVMDGSLFGSQKITQVKAGVEHVIALDEQGQLWSWGENFSSQLGSDVDLFGSDVPALVDVSALEGSAVASFSVGKKHNILTDANGRFWAWGADSSGQLGDGEVDSVTELSEVFIPESVYRVSVNEALHGSWETSCQPHINSQNMFYKRRFEFSGDKMAVMYIDYGFSDCQGEGQGVISTSLYKMTHGEPIALSSGVTANTLPLEALLIGNQSVSSFVVNVMKDLQQEKLNAMLDSLPQTPWGVNDIYLVQDGYLYFGDPSSDNCVANRDTALLFDISVDKCGPTALDFEMAYSRVSDETPAIDSGLLNDTFVTSIPSRLEGTWTQSCVNIEDPEDDEEKSWNSTLTFKDGQLISNVVAYVNTDCQLPIEYEINSRFDARDAGLANSAQSSTVYALDLKPVMLFDDTKEAHLSEWLEEVEYEIEFLDSDSGPEYDELQANRAELLQQIETINSINWGYSFSYYLISDELHIATNDNDEADCKLSEFASDFINLDDFPCREGVMDFTRSFTKDAPLVE